ncbi:MAG: radical SAM protein [Thermoplasmatales archaeon]|nr:radical SAM protein [Thermoplasmatales archaeon]
MERKANVINLFDPWKSKLCTCPKKYSFNPYTGCSHACIYCYISSYIKNPFKARVKKNVLRNLAKEVEKVDTYISMANSGDAYTPEEEKIGITRKCLEIFKEKNIPVLIITKSDIVKRDIDILREMKASVSITITTLSIEKARKVEPNAPLPERRIKAIETLAEEGILCSVRIDPILPGFNDDEIEEIVESISPFVKHVVASTLKPRRDSFERLKGIIEIEKYSWRRVGNSFYLPEKIRYFYLEKVEEACRRNNLSFGACREGYKFYGKTCDGGHLIYGGK